MPFFKFDNKKIYYEITGKGPVIILHHGLKKKYKIQKMMLVLHVTII